MRRFLSIAAKDAKIDIPVTPHVFRRSCVTEMIKRGADPDHVKELLGHESLDTLNSYVNLSIKDLKETHAKYHPGEREDGTEE